MIDEKHHKSRGHSRFPKPRDGLGGQFPRYGFAGLALIIVGEILLFQGNTWVGLYFTPLAWTGYILFMDALIKKQKGRSLIADHIGEFFLLAVISIGSWYIFEGYNVLLKNWRYLGLPESRMLRYFGYAWSFATISPALFVTYEAVTLFWKEKIPTGDTKAPPVTGAPFVISVLGGLGCLVVPLIWPSTWMTPLVWIGFVFFLDPINSRLGERSILAELYSGRATPLFQMFLAGFICGVLWEFWNFWSTARWEYDVPYWGHIKLFEMPVLGFLGFLPFTIECFAIYKFLRRILPIPLRERYLG